MDVMFVETSVFTRRIVALGLEDSLRELQTRLLQNHELGDIDPGTGGLRKVRMPDPARGKGAQGGVRVHYLTVPHVARIFLVFVYAKNEGSTLTSSQKRALKTVVRQSKAEFRMCSHE